MTGGTQRREGSLFISDVMRPRRVHEANHRTLRGKRSLLLKWEGYMYKENGIEEGQLLRPCNRATSVLVFDFFLRLF